MSQTWGHIDASRVSEDIGMLFFFLIPRIYVHYLNAAGETTILGHITLVYAFLSLYEHKAGPGGYI